MPFVSTSVYDTGSNGTQHIHQAVINELTEARREFKKKYPTKLAANTLTQPLAGLQGFLVLVAANARGLDGGTYAER